MGLSRKLRREMSEGGAVICIDTVKTFRRDAADTC